MQVIYDQIKRGAESQELKHRETKRHRQAGKGSV